MNSSSFQSTQRSKMFTLPTCYKDKGLALYTLNCIIFSTWKEWRIPSHYKQNGAQIHSWIKMKLCNWLKRSSWKLSIPYTFLKMTRSTGCWNARFHHNHNCNEHQLLLHSSKTSRNSICFFVRWDDSQILLRGEWALEYKMKAKLQDLFGGMTCVWNIL